MVWTVLLHDDFAAELPALPVAVQNGLANMIGLLEQRGPRLRRPHCDTLKGSKHTNMKELRFNAAGGVWRVAFAFDPNRNAVLLIGGDKSGINQKRFYDSLIRVADDRFDAWMED
jgi:hypothetical protein